MGKLFEELRNLKAEYDRKIAEEGEDAIKDAFKYLFDKYADLKAVTWIQYTPYFNDGSPCYFIVYNFDVFMDSDEELKKEIAENKDAMEKAAANKDFALAEDLKESIEELQAALDGSVDYSEYGYGETHSNTDVANSQEIIDAVMELESELPEDLLESVFGDHCQVIVTREGIKVTEYHHD